MDENDNLLIYLCGHGRDTFLKICDTYYLFRGDLMRCIAETSRRVRRLLLIIDTCEAETLVERGSVPGNTFVVTTSLPKQSAYSAELDPKLGVCPVNLFPHMLSRQIAALRRGHRRECTARLVDLFGGLGKGELQSSITHCKKNEFMLDDFFVQDSSDGDREIRPFVL